jgi:hypothetical protein
MVHSKLWLTSYARFIEFGEFRLESDVLRHIWNSNLHEIKRTVLTSHFITEEGEFNVGYMQTRINNFYKKMVESFKKHKQVSKNLHYVKECENIEVKGMYEVYKHLHQERSKCGVKLIVRNCHNGKHFEIVKQMNSFDLKVLIMIYICSVIIYIMCLYVLFLIYLLYL